MHGRQRYARFLLAYMLETPDGPGAEALGRGWVVKVPEENEPALAHEMAPVWFSTLSEVGEVIRRLLDERTPADAGKRSTSR